MTKVEIGLQDVQREAVARVLSALLADEYVLYTKTRYCHWNVTGPRFNDLHKFFESQYDDLAEKVDEVAERIRSLGHLSPGSLTEFVKLARLKETPGARWSAEQMCAVLLADHEQLIRQLRGDVEAVAAQGDAGTNDFLTGLMEDHEKMAWMLRSLADS